MWTGCADNSSGSQPNSPSFSPIFSFPKPSGSSRLVLFAGFALGRRGFSSVELTSLLSLCSSLRRLQTGDLGVPVSPQNVPLGLHRFKKKKLSLENLEMSHKNLYFCLILKNWGARVMRGPSVSLVSSCPTTPPPEFGINWNLLGMQIPRPFPRPPTAESQSGWRPGNS